MATKLTPRQRQKEKEAEAGEQRNRLKVALGAGGIGAVVGLTLPVVGGVAVAMCGAAAAIGLTTRSDDLGDAARASGSAAVGGVSTLRDTLKRNKAGEKVRASIRTTREALRGVHTSEAPAVPRTASSEKGWFAGFGWGEAASDRAAKRAAYGAAPTAAEAAELMARDLAGVDPAKRRRYFLEQLRDLHPDKCAVATIAARAVATTLTRIAVAVRDHLDDVGWDAFEARGADAVAKDCAALVRE